MSIFDEVFDADEPEFSVQQRVEAFYKCTHAIGNFAEEKVIPVLTGQLNPDDREQAVTGIYYRMYLWIKSMTSLNNALHFQAAVSATRALFELLLDLKLLASDANGTLVAKFHAFTEVERFRWAKELVAFSDKYPDVALEVGEHRTFIEQPGKESQIEKIVVSHWGRTRNDRPNRPDHWSGMNVRERAIKCGPSYEAKYLYDYRFGCWSAHSGPTIYAGLKKETFETMYGLAHSLSLIYFLEATVICAKLVGIHQAVEEFDDIIGELETVPETVLTEIQIRNIRESKEKAGL